MELRQLEYFVAVADEANFTRAAARLHVAQPGVSAQIRQLERELGQPLFDRSGRTVRLTEVGAAVLPYARAALAAADGARHAVEEFTGLVRGRVAICMSSSLSSLLDLPDLLAGFHDRHPHVEITLIEDNTERMAEELRAGRLDLAIFGIGADDPPGIAVQDIYDDVLVMATSADEPEGDRTVLTLADVAAHPLICLPRGTGMRGALDRAFAAAGLRPRIAFESSDPMLVIQLTAQGLGRSVLPEGMVRGHPGMIRSVPFRPRIRSRLVLAWKAEGPATPAARAIISYARTALRARREYAPFSADAPVAARDGTGRQLEQH